MNANTTQAAPEEHPFAPFIRILGKGKTGSRSLSENEAYQAMQLILHGQVKEVQLGAFLMLLRVKEESPEELAGFARAVRDAIHAPIEINADLDWSSYAGKRRQQNWYVLAALCLAENGIKIFMHGAAGHTAGRLYTEQILKELGITVATDWQQVKQQLADTNFSFFPIHTLSPMLQTMMDYRNDFGLRSPVHSLSRLINPLQANYSIQSIFHPSYADSHREANRLQGQLHAAVFKGEAGEVERRPEARTLVKYLHNDKLSEVQWPMLLEGRQSYDTDLSSNALKAFWRGDIHNEYGYHAVIGTMAVVLHLMQKADTPADAQALAENYWQQRRLNRFNNHNR